MPAVLRVVLLVSDLPGKGSAKLGQSAEIGIELEGDHALVLPVVVTEDIAPVRQRQRVNGSVDALTDGLLLMRARLALLPDRRQTIGRYDAIGSIRMNAEGLARYWRKRWEREATSA